MKTPANSLSLSPQKKRRRSGILEDCPPPVDINTPQRVEKKRKKWKEEEEVRFTPSAGNENMGSPKKKRKNSEEGEQQLEKTQVEEETSEKEKKKKKRKEAAILLPANIGNMSSLKKKKKKQKNKVEEEMQVESQTIESEKKKKKRKKEAAVEMQVESQTIESEKKKKKRKKEAAEEMQVESQTSESEKKKKKRKKEAAEEMQVESQTSESEKKKKKRKKEAAEEMQVESQTSESEKKKKKKKKNKTRLTEDSVVIVTTDDNHSETDCLVSKKTNNISMRMKKNKCNNPVEVMSKKGEEIERKRGQAKDIEQMRKDKEHLLVELREFVPDIDKKPWDTIYRLLRYDLSRFKAFKQQGLRLRNGRFTKAENELIRKNVLDFMALVGINSAERLIFPARCKEQEAEIRKLKARHRFFERIAEGIPRSCHDVFTRAKKLLDERNCKGRFSQDEMHSLVKLQKLHGNSWSTISKKMDRSIYALQKRFDTIVTGHGLWSKDEESRLKLAVKTYLEELVQNRPADCGLTREEMCNNLPWKEISDHVGTRSWCQCRVKWFCFLKMKLWVIDRNDRGTDELQRKINVINVLYNMNVEDMADINWDAVAESVGSSTSMCVQRSFYRLKVYNVPNSSRLSYGEIIDYLQLNVVPAFKERLSKLGVQHVQQEEAQGVTRHFLSDIFSEDVCMELDNS